jgi:hypothetical protein
LQRIGGRWCGGGRELTFLGWEEILGARGVVRVVVL